MRYRRHRVRVHSGRHKIKTKRKSGRRKAGYRRRSTVNGKRAVKRRKKSYKAGNAKPTRYVSRRGVRTLVSPEIRRGLQAEDDRVRRQMDMLLHNDTAVADMAKEWRVEPAAARALIREIRDGNIR